jgi:hypothetical protein
MYTSCLVGLMLAQGISVDTPVWQKSYGGALEAGQKQGRPVAVFVGSGPQGQAALVKDGHFSPELLKVLAQNYVCLYLDRSQSSNQSLISDLGIAKTGLVISDRTGAYQAYHHDGAISQADLARQLGRFASPNLVVSRTISNGTQRVSYYNGSGVEPAAFSGGTVRC